MCKLNTIYPDGLHSVFSRNNFNNFEDVCAYSKFNLAKVNYNYKRGSRGKKKKK